MLFNLCRAMLFLLHYGTFKRNPKTGISPFSRFPDAVAVAVIKFPERTTNVHVANEARDYVAKAK